MSYFEDKKGFHLNLLRFEVSERVKCLLEKKTNNQSVYSKQRDRKQYTFSKNMSLKKKSHYF